MYLHINAAQAMNAPCQRVDSPPLLLVYSGRITLLCDGDEPQEKNQD